MIKSILLLAGLSRRCGKQNKLITPYKGSPLFTYSLSASLSCADTIVVLGYQSELVEKQISSFLSSKKFPHKIEIVHNEDYEKGQFTSICRGLRALESGDDFCITLGDTPFLTPEIFATLLDKFKTLPPEYKALRPFFENKPLHPAFFCSSARENILKRSADYTLNLKDVIKIENIKVLHLETGYNLLCKDVDFLEDFED